MSAWARIVGLLLLVAPTTAHATPPLPAADVEELLRQVADRPTAALSHALFVGLVPHLEALGSAAQDRWLRAIAGAPAPLLAARAALERARSTAAREEVPEVLRRLGLATSWLVVGPEPADDPSAAHRAVVRGAAPHPGGAVTLSGRDLHWERLDDFGPPGALALDHLVSGVGEEVVHAVTAWRADRPARAALRLGAVGAVAVSFNGVELGGAAELAHAALDQLEAEVSLRAGPNVLVVSVAPGARRGPLVLARLTAPSGGPAPGLHPIAELDAEAWPEPSAAGAAPGLGPGPRGPAGGLRAQLARAGLRRAMGLPDRGDDPLLEELLGSAGAARLPARELLLWLPQVPRDEARATLVAGLVAEPGAPPALLLALAHLAADRGQIVRARRAIASLPPTAAGLAETAALLASRVDRLDGRPESAWRRLAARLDDDDPAEALLGEAARAAFQIGRHDRAAELHERLAAGLPGRLDHRAAAVMSLGTVGRGPELLAGLEALAAARPDRLAYRLEAARVAIALGEPDRARLHLTATSGRAWFREDLLDRVASLFEAIGDTRAAIELAERSLALRPASLDARARIERLGGEEPVPLTLAVTPELLARPPMSADVAFEVLADEVVYDVEADGSATRYARRVLRAQRVPEDRAARTFTIDFEPGHEAVRVLGARVHRGDLSFDVTERELRTVGEDWYGLYYDLRRLAIPFDDLQPGDVVEVTTRRDTTRQLFRGVFDQLEVLQDGMPRHHLRYEVRAPESLGLRSRLFVPPALEGQGARLTTTDEVLPDGRVRIAVHGESLPAIAFEPLMPGAAEVGASWQVTTFRDWSDLARWYHDLIAPQAVITPSMRAFVEELVRGATTRAGLTEPLLVRRILDAVTRDIRYVGLEFGVHGYMPYRTDQIWARRFGDCKDQAILLTALLELAGVEAHVVLVRTRRRGRVPDALPGLALFDHAMVWLPGSDLYVDPTASLYGAGELPWEDQGAQMLVVGAAGEELRLSPVDPSERNGVQGSYTLALRPTGGARVSGIVTMRGVHAPSYRSALADPDARARNLEGLLNRRYPGLALRSHRVSDPTDRARPIELVFEANVSAVAERYEPGPGEPSEDCAPAAPGGVSAPGEPGAAVDHRDDAERAGAAGARDEVGGHPGGARAPPSGGCPAVALSIPRPAGADGHLARLASLSAREHPLVLGPPARHETVFRYVLPVGWEVASRPGDRAETSAFGAFSVRWQEEPGAVAVTTAWSLATDAVSAADYPAFRAFMQAFDAAVRPPLVIRAAGAVGEAPAPEVAPNSPLDRCRPEAWDQGVAETRRSWEGGADPIAAPPPCLRASVAIPSATTTTPLGGRCEPDCGSPGRAGTVEPKARSSAGPLEVGAIAAGTEGHPRAAAGEGARSAGQVAGEEVR